MSDDAAALSLARRLGGFAQDARDLAGALKAAAADSAGPPAGALASMAELAQVVARRIALLGADVIAAERLLGALAGGAPARTAAEAEPRPEGPSAESPTATPTPPPALGAFGAPRAPAQRPSLAELQKMTPMQRLRTMS